MKVRFALLLFTLAAPFVVTGEYIDLTYGMNQDVVLWPGREIKIITEHEGEIPGVGFLAARGFCMSEHTSTHIDAPYHFNKNGWTLDQVPLESLLDVSGVCIDISDKVHVFKDGRLSTVYNYVLTRQDILDWESVNGQIPARSLVLLRTGWSSRWNNADDYKGIKSQFRGQNSTLDPDSAADELKRLNFPGFDASAATFLTVERDVLGVGIDTLSIDAGHDQKFPAHKIFAKRNRYMLENAANLHLLPPKGFRLWAVPFKVDSGTGSPTRLLAKINGF